MVFPYLKGLHNNKVIFPILFCVSIVVILFAYIWYLTSGIKALSLATKKGIFFLYFADFFKKKKRGLRHSRQFP
jgi:hypothetical protein